MLKNKFFDVGGGCFVSGTELVYTCVKTCTCYAFLDKAVCQHLTAACLVLDIPLLGLKLKSLSLRTVRRRIKPNNNKSISYSPLCSPDVSLAAHEDHENVESIGDLNGRSIGNKVLTLQDNSIDNTNDGHLDDTVDVIEIQITKKSQRSKLVLTLSNFPHHQETCFPV